jgi:hypothetical protein
MFTMMNNARLAVGIQGLSIAERAYQHAVVYARERVQGGKSPIIAHPDVRRMLLTMRALTQGMRCLVLYAAGALDRAKRHPDVAERAKNQALTDLLIPIVKAWCTDRGVEVASLGVQVYGGVGFIEETGAAQYYRDARIAPIYEGTNGIQAMDLVGRKLMRDDGKAMRALLAEMSTSVSELTQARAAIESGIKLLEHATSSVLAGGKQDTNQALAVATPYLSVCGTVMAGWLLARSAARANGADPTFVEAKQATAAFFAANILPEADADAALVTGGAPSTLSFPVDAF